MSGSAAVIRAIRRAAARAVRRIRFGPLRYVVVVSYGRTGSTLLQGALMSAPHVLIRGEQGGTIVQQQIWFDELCRHQRRLARQEETTRRHPFFGIVGFQQQQALRRIRMLLLESLLRPKWDTRVLGFKENRWPDDPTKTLVFLRKLLPGVRFVVNTRNDDDVALSGFWPRRPDALQQIRRRRESLLAAAQSLGDDVYFVHYDDWAGNPESLRGLFEWLQIPFSVERVAEVMQKPHSYRNRTIREIEILDEQRRLSPQARLAARRPVTMLAATWTVVAAGQVAALATAVAGVGPFAT